jgi:hypothetical protein
MGSYSRGGQRHVILGDPVNNNQQPGWPEQPRPNGNDGTVPPPPPAAPGQPPYGGQPSQPEQPGQPPYPAQPQYPAQPPYGAQPPYAGQPPYGDPAQPQYPGQPPYGDPAQPQYQGQPQYPAQPQPGQDPWAQQPYGQQPYGAPGSAPGTGAGKPKGRIPLWGWIGGGVAVVALLGVGGVVLANSMAGALKPKPVPCGSGASGCLPPSPSASADPEASGDPAPAPSGEAESLYLFDDSDFTAPPVWSIQKSSDWQMQSIKGGTITYRNSSNNCLFTTHQAILPPTDETTDEAATALSMEQEIAGIKSQAAGTVDVVEDSGSVYAKLRNDDGAVIELQGAELRFKNRKNVDVVFRIALRSMPGSDGLMELTQACPASAPAEDLVWSENTDSVTMKDDPSVKKP